LRPQLREVRRIAGSQKAPNRPIKANSKPQKPKLTTKGTKDTKKTPGETVQRK